MLVCASWWVPVLSFWLVTAAPADAGAPAEQVRSFALLLFEKGEPDPLLVRGMLDAFVHLDEGSPEITLAHGRALEAHLGTDVTSAITACGADLTCIAALGRRAAVRQVLYARATALEQGGIGIQFLLIGVETAEVDGKIVVTVDDVAGVTKAVTAVAHELWGIDAGAVEQRLAAAPAEESESPAPEPALPAPSLSPSAPPAPNDPREIRRPPRWPFYAAALLGAAGAGATAAGVHYGRRSRSYDDDTRYGPGRTVLPSTLAAEEAAKRDATRATLLFAAGAVLLGSGAALCGYSWMTAGPSVAIAVSQGPAASVSLRW